MPDTYNHGVRVIEATDGARLLTTISTAIVGLVSTSADADAATFPVGERVLITDINAAITKAGAGLLKTVLTAIAAQAAPVIIAIRAEIGANAAATEANIVAALDLLLAAESDLGFKPRIIGAPGLETEVVAKKIEAIAPKLRGVGYVGASLEAEDFEDVAAYREEFTAREVMLLWPDWKSGETVWPAAAVALGLRAAIDTAQGWNKTLSNVAVAGVTSITKPLNADQAKLLNSLGVTACHRRKGYRFWGSRTCAEDTRFKFESATRTAQVLMDTMEDGMDWAIDKPITRSLERDVVETINASFRRLTSGGYILGAEAQVRAEDNPVTALSAGKLSIEFEYTDTPPLEDLTIIQRKTDTFLASLTSGG